MSSKHQSLSTLLNQKPHIFHQAGLAKDLVTLREASNILGISRWTLRRSASRGEIPSTRIGRRYLISLIAIRELAIQESKKIKRQVRTHKSQ